jgi:hypothetical protein
MGQNFDLDKNVARGLLAAGLTLLIIATAD